ncbi:hypothetical protein [Sphingorhabdus sp. Alg239-R122]|uniref:hypothetical protein n=1 Tax=Sphingorhabdus sp. Alg239-R122 TaxID=2305989 RepID=UPI0013DB7784|nr:hypothetical protein [Sphingorhabdus sp. Alg239-R122]
MKEGMQLSDTAFWILFCFFILSICIVCYLWGQIVLMDSPPITISMKQIAAVTSYSSICFSSLYYIRKLYKDKFAMTVKINSSPTSQAATIAYFLTRPLFAMLISMFSIVVICGIIASSAHEFSGFSWFFWIHISTASALTAAITGTMVRRFEIKAEVE